MVTLVLHVVMWWCRLPGYWAGLKEEGLVRDVTSTPPSRSNTDWTKSTLAATTMEDFELMAIHDPGVLQGCMDLSFKTPAQLLMEFQSKNKGIAVNYTTVTLAGEGKGDRSAFKVTASVGPTAAEGIAGNKKVAKQLAAQALLAQLNPRVATYCDLIRLHENNVKLHADGVNRAKLQKLATKYGGGTMSTSSTSGGSPGLATAQPALLPSPTSSLAVAPGIVPEPSASTSNHGRRYGKGQVPNSYRVGWDPGHPRRGQRIDNNLYHGYGGHAAPVESNGMASSLFSLMSAVKDSVESLPKHGVIVRRAAVPGTVDAGVFWSHYLYKASLLAAQEQRGALLLEKDSALDDAEEKKGEAATCAGTNASTEVSERPQTPDEGWVDVPTKTEAGTAASLEAKIVAVAIDDEDVVDWGDDDDDDAPAAAPEGKMAPATDEWGQWE
ncbi:hypothetical protein DYB32_003650 [Aphanomyces invadans]|uniref:DRBM domain-containing protein n=1 Tax=Aphanomyces invadans TaxID=157072 RepID=A0A3R6VZ92_9STRA|nr:hypothetical protein DYB32_003650 [Aphanomyces invadans]